MNMEIFFAFFWGLMAADAVFLCLVVLVIAGWKFHQRGRSRRRWGR